MTYFLLRLYAMKPIADAIANKESMLGSDTSTGTGTRVPADAILTFARKTDTIEANLIFTFFILFNPYIIVNQLPARLTPKKQSVLIQ